MLTTPAINLSPVTMTSAILIAGKNGTGSPVTTTPPINLSPMSTTQAIKMLDEYQSEYSLK
jgi:hypothetical protein